MTTRLRDGVFSVEAHEIPQAVQVWEASVRATHDFLSEADINFFRLWVAQGLPQAETLVCVRDTAGQITGFMTVAGDEIGALFVHPAWRGQGVGRRLVSYAVDELGTTRVDVNEQNAQAVGFYKRMGFQVMGRSPLDGTGKPFPLLHMKLGGEVPVK